MQQSVRVVALCGSLRQASFNRRLIGVAQAAAPAGMAIEIAEIRDLPLYDEDIEKAGMPAPVAWLRGQVAAADALLFACPEYNFSISGALKNAIDWASRPPNTPLTGKPYAIMGAGGRLGAARAQYHLRQICGAFDMKPVNKPEVFVINAPAQFDQAGALTDETARGLIRDLVANLHAWTLRLRMSQP